MAERKFLVCLLLCLLDCVVGSDILCEEGFCRTFVNDDGCTEPAAHCRINNATHTGLWLPSPTMCNCCEYCLPFYGKEEYCSLGGTGTGTTIGRCTDGHTCVAHEDGDSYCQRMDTDCHRAQDDYDQRYATGQVGILEERPLCDGKGLFAHISCVPTQTCFCQTEEGERIFGEAPNLGAGMAERMQCGCSMLYHKITSTISPGVPAPVTPPRCTSDGNFHPVQCIADVCHCVNVITGRILQGERRSVDLTEEAITKLICYDPVLDNYPEQSEGNPPYNFTTPCYESIQEVADWIQQSIEDGYSMDYHNSLPECLPDGSSGRISLLGNGTKICVDEGGQQIENYSAAPGTPEFENMDCKCALTSHIMTSNELPVCCKNGNFRSVQCRRGVCWCVDSDGRQLGKEAENIMTLSCFNVNWRDWCSMLYHKITSTISPGVPAPVTPPRCTSDGNFHPVQCIADVCHCVNVITGRILHGERRSVDLTEEPITKLICYDPVLDNYPEQSEGNPPYNFTTPCYESIQEVADWIQQSIEDGYSMDYHNSLPECLPDGSSGRISLLGNGTKICVDEGGQQIENYSAAPGTPEFESMDCKCALTSHIMTSNELPVCCKNGNFRSVQCRRGVCWCVDSDGRQLGKEAENIMTLSCFNVNWRDC